MLGVHGLSWSVMFCSVLLGSGNMRQAGKYMFNVKIHQTMSASSISLWCNASSCQSQQQAGHRADAKAGKSVWEGFTIVELCIRREEVAEGTLGVGPGLSTQDRDQAGNDEKSPRSRHSKRCRLHLLKDVQTRYLLRSKSGHNTEHGQPAVDDLWCSRLEPGGAQEC